MIETSQVNYSIVKVDKSTEIFTLNGEDSISLVFSKGNNEVCLTIDDFETGMDIVGILLDEIDKLRGSRKRKSR